MCYKLASPFPSPLPPNIATPSSMIHTIVLLCLLACSSAAVTEEQAILEVWKASQRTLQLLADVSCQHVELWRAAHEQSPDQARYREEVKKFLKHSRSSF